MATNEGRFDIVEGPGKFEIMVALFDAKQITFTVQLPDPKGKEKVLAQINSVEIEDGSRESWIIKGYTNSNYTTTRAPFFEGYYNSRTRKGWLNLIMQ